MTTTFPIYPAYCFSQSPTFNRWVKLTAADVHSLRCERGFEGQKIYFHLNHPIRHVYLTGCVVAIDSPFARYTILTIDDGSDAIIDARITHILPDDEDVGRDDRLRLDTFRGASRPRTTVGRAEREERGKEEEQEGEEDENEDEYDVEDGSKKMSARLRVVTMKTQTEGLTVTSGPGVHIVRLGTEIIDIGTVLKLKGTIHVWRDSFQLTLLRAYVAKTMDEEIRIWKEYAEDWCKILMQPWHLSESELRNLEAAENQLAQHRAEKRRKTRQRQQAREERRRRVEAKVNEKIQKMSTEIDGNPLDRKRGYTKG